MAVTTWNLTFFKNLVESAIAAGAATLAGSLLILQAHTFTVAGLEGALVGAGVGALYSFCKNLGASQAFAGKAPSKVF